MEFTFSYFEKPHAGYAMSFCYNHEFTKFTFKGTVKYIRVNTMNSVMDFRCSNVTN